MQSESRSILSGIKNSERKKKKNNYRDKTKSDTDSDMVLPIIVTEYDIYNRITNLYLCK